MRDAVKGVPEQEYILDRLDKIDGHLRKLTEQVILTSCQADTVASIVGINSERNASYRYGWSSLSKFIAQEEDAALAMQETP